MMKRVKEPLVAIVKGKDEGDDAFWNESSEVVSYSKNGASLYLTRSRVVGSLLSLLIPLPSELRVYDEELEHYRVWAIVQHCNPVGTDSDPRFMIGVAFIGRTAPAGHAGNPLRTYRVTGCDETGMWRIAKTERSFVVRKDPRYWVELKAVISLVASEGDLFEEEETATENISLHGSSVVSRLEPKIGSLLEFNYPEVDFSAVARVCNIAELPGKKRRLHLEFIDAEFPINRIVLPTDDNAPMRPASL